MREHRVRGKVTIITGASQGIGKEIAFTFARAGARLVLAARSAEALEDLAAALRREGAEVLVVPTDVSREADVQHLIELTQSTYHRIDIVVCNAGVYIRSAVKDVTLATIRKTMDVNYYGTVSVILAVLPLLLAQRNGHIIAISSVAGKKGLPKDAAYAASKFAITGFMDVLRQELHGSGVYASTILPERVDTEMIGTLRVPLVSRKLPPARVARAVLRAVRQRRREIVISFFGPKALILASALWPALGDWVVRVFGLEGVEMVEGRTYE